MEKYIFLDFDGVLNTPKGKFDQKARHESSFPYDSK